MKCEGNTAVVADGHGGPEAAQFTVESFESLAQLHEMSKEDIVRRVKDLNNCFLTSREAESKSCGRAAGSTMTTVTVLPDMVHATHLGDSGAIIVTKEGVKEITKDDEVTGEEMTAAVKRGGVVQAKHKTTYIKMPGGSLCLNMTRALGNKPLRPVVSDTPHVSICKLHEGDTHVVVASDGIWKALRKVDVGSMIKNGVALDEIVQAASAKYRPHTPDDISIAVYALPGSQQPDITKQSRGKKRGRGV